MAVSGVYIYIRGYASAPFIACMAVSGVYIYISEGMLVLPIWPYLVYIYIYIYQRVR